MTVPTSTTPPVPGCLVMTLEPSAWISASGKPGWRSTDLESSVLGEEGVVAAGGLRTALQDVPGDHRARERVVVLRAPAEVGGGRPGDEGGVGDPAGDDDVGARAQAGGDADAAQVGVGGQGSSGVLGGEVVALDVGDADGDAEPVGQLPDGVGESGRVEPARVGDDPHAALVGEPEALLQLAQEGRGVPGRGIADP